MDNPKFYLEVLEKDQSVFSSMLKEYGIDFESQNLSNGMTGFMIDEQYRYTVDFIINKMQDKKTSQPQRQPSLDERIKNTQRVAKPPEKKPEPPKPPSKIENRWAEEKMAEELKENQKASDIQSPVPETQSKKGKRRKGQGKTYQIKMRVNKKDREQFLERVKKSGLSQTEFLRQAALTGKIEIIELGAEYSAFLDDVSLIRRDTGRISGALVSVIKPNEKQRELSPVDWAKLMKTIDELQDLKLQLADMVVNITNGNRNSSNK